MTEELLIVEVQDLLPGDALVAFPDDPVVSIEPGEQHRHRVLTLVSGRVATFAGFVKVKRGAAPPPPPPEPLAPEQEACVCRVCGRVWIRDKAAGRKPVYCSPRCRSNSRRVLHREG